MQNQCGTLNNLYGGMQRDLFQHPNLSKFLSFHTALSYGMGIGQACRQYLAFRFYLSFQKNVDKSNTACTKIILSFFLRKDMFGWEAWLAFPFLPPVCQKHCTRMQSCTRMNETGEERWIIKKLMNRKVEIADKWNENFRPHQPFSVHHLSRLSISQPWV